MCICVYVSMCIFVYVYIFNHQTKFIGSYLANLAPQVEPSRSMVVKGPIDNMKTLNCFSVPFLKSLSRIQHSVEMKNDNILCGKTKACIILYIIFAPAPAISQNESHNTER